MDLLDKKSDESIIQSIIAEAAKARNELNCAEADLKKAQSRLSFILVLTNELINRKGD